MNESDFGPHMDVCVCVYLNVLSSFFINVFINLNILPFIQVFHTSCCYGLHTDVDIVFCGMCKTVMGIHVYTYICKYRYCMNICIIPTSYDLLSPVLLSPTNTQTCKLFAFANVGWQATFLTTQHT